MAERNKSLVKKPFAFSAEITGFLSGSEEYAGIFPGLFMHLIAGFTEMHGCSATYLQTVRNKDYICI